VSVQEIKDKLATLPQKEQDEVAAYLFHLRQLNDTPYQEAVSRRLADKDPSHWLSPGDFEKELNKRQFAL
jgi:hypothetical protein